MNKNLVTNVITGGIMLAIGLAVHNFLPDKSANNGNNETVVENPGNDSVEIISQTDYLSLKNFN